MEAGLPPSAAVNAHTRSKRVLVLMHYLYILYTVCEIIDDDEYEVLVYFFLSSSFFSSSQNSAYDSQHRSSSSTQSYILCGSNDKPVVKKSVHFRRLSTGILNCLLVCLYNITHKTIFRLLWYWINYYFNASAKTKKKKYLYNHIII